VNSSNNISQGPVPSSEVFEGLWDHHDYVMIARASKGILEIGQFLTKL